MGSVILWVTALFLLVQGCLCITEQTNIGCNTWTLNGSDACCQTCHPGNRLVKNCGPKPQELCTPCLPETYTQDPLNYECKRCTQCVGAQVLLKQCTTTSDTVCGCKEGLMCGNEKCTFCVDKCGKGQEPTANRSCRACPSGTFNNETHQKCQPWSKCSNPDWIVAKGDAFTDIKCEPSTDKVVGPTSREETWPLILTVLATSALVAVVIILIMIMKINLKRKATPTITKLPIIRTPTDDPRTLIAIECSFHEAEQEHGSSSESLVSSEVSKQLIT